MAKQHLPIAPAAQITPGLRREKFIQEYLSNGYNAMQAARAAGFSSYAKSSYNLMRNPLVLRAIKARTDEIRQRNDVSLDKIIVQLSKIAFFDIAKIYDENGRLRPLHMIAPEVRAAIAGVESEELFGKDGTPAYGMRRTVKLVDPIRAMELLARLLGFATKVDMNFTGLPGAEASGGVTHKVVFEDLTQEPITPHEEVKLLQDAGG